jgi:cystathionine gamma-synthase
MDTTHLETLAIHAGHVVDPATGAVTMPIHLSTTYERAVDGTFPKGFIYTRDANPTRHALETCLAALEGGAAALAFASGSAATMSVFQALGPGAHVVAPHDAYYGTGALLRDVFAPWGLGATFVDMTDLDEVARALRAAARTIETRQAAGGEAAGGPRLLLWVETPSNPRVRVSDLAALVALAREVGALVAVDNTWATPVATRPLALGADLVMHSTTKFLGGHSDLLGGALVAHADDAFVARLRTLQKTGGAVPSPFDCWLLLRGIRTLPWRVRAHSANAMTVANALAAHPAVEAVHYPGLPDDPGHAVATRQMAASGTPLYGGMLALRVRGARAEALAMAGRLRLVTRATSLGGPETLIEHRASIEGARTQAPENLLRLSVGLEHPDDVIADLVQALDG